VVNSKTQVLLRVKNSMEGKIPYEAATAS